MVRTATLRRPSVSSRSSWLSRVCAPPMPVPTTHPSRSGSRSGSPASAQASRAATSATCWHRSSRRASTLASTSVGSTFRGALIRTGRLYLSTQGSSRILTPLVPSSMACQVSGAVPPMGVVAPMPVTTTSWSLVIRHSPLPALPAGVGPVSVDSFVAFDVGDRVSHRLQVGQLVVRDLDAELVLGLHGDLDHGQRVDVEVVGEGLVGADVGGAHAGDLLDDLGQSGEGVLVAHDGSFRWVGSPGAGRRRECQSAFCRS